MPQGPIQVSQTPNDGGIKSSLYVKTKAVVKAAAGRIATINVLVTGTAGMVYDSPTTAGMVTGAEVAVIPATAGPVELNFPCLTGIAIDPGNGQIVSVSYS